MVNAGVGMVNTEIGDREQATLLPNGGSGRPRAARTASCIGSVAIGAPRVLPWSRNRPSWRGTPMTPEPKSPKWEVLRCPRCDLAIMSSSADAVRTLLLCHIQICGAPEEPELEDGGD